MVQESEAGSQKTGKVASCQSWDNTSRKSGFQAIQSKEQEKKADNKNKNPWGPIFKDKKNFANLHNC
ncbi:hypothetical protein ILUMI_12594 [Ignelater luminosus]|uniref:Uncharacterized protein n=1 Tax=Ignelater luminosus TaxID=2038154 RepID=A0A8K0G6L8_IGNLU|nr:hypothetical protein ILUMI_12594 [Ignelater luminosus]